jgi:hypothetical protein
MKLISLHCSWTLVASAVEQILPRPTQTKGPWEAAFGTMNTSPGCQAWLRFDTKSCKICT